MYLFSSVRWVKVSVEVWEVNMLWGCSEAFTFLNAGLLNVTVFCGIY